MASHHTHVATGLLTGTLIATTLNLGSAGTALFALSSGGAALLADVDTPDSAISHAGGWILAFPFWALRKMTVKHRGLSHTLLAVLVVSSGVFLTGYFFTTSKGWLPAHWPTRILIPALLAMLATRSVLTFGSGKRGVGENRTFHTIISRRHRFYIDALVGLTIVYLGISLGNSPHFTYTLTLAVGIGYLTHLVIDAIFNGVPMFWPFPPSLQPTHRFTLGHFRTGGLFDHVLGWSSLLLTIALFLSAAFPSWHVSHLLHLINL